MVVSGAQPVQRQFVEFEAKGLLKTPPEQIRRVELVRADQHVSLLRRGENGWATPAGAEIDAAVGKRISTAVQMMHNSGPAREIPPASSRDTDPAAFGLDVPRITASFYDSGGDPVLASASARSIPTGSCNTCGSRTTIASTSCRASSARHGWQAFDGSLADDETRWLVALLLVLTMLIGSARRTPPASPASPRSRCRDRPCATS